MILRILLDRKLFSLPSRQPAHRHLSRTFSHPLAIQFSGHSTEHSASQLSDHSAVHSASQLFGHSSEHSASQLSGHSALHSASQLLGHSAVHSASRQPVLRPLSRSQSTASQLCSLSRLVPDRPDRRLIISANSIYRSHSV